MNKGIPVILSAAFAAAILFASGLEGKAKQYRNASSVTQTDTSGLHYVNVNFMLRGYFQAYSSPDSNEVKNGWYSSGNTPQQLDRPALFSSGKLSLVIDTSSTEPFAKIYRGYPVYIANTTTDTAVFDAQDSRLYMKVQALNRKGEWQDIEYLPSSTCGNSYHEVRLEPDACWKFVMPAYTGKIKTKLRIQLITGGKRGPTEEKIIYSNSISGRINKEQFSKKQGYQSGGIMDPYVD